MNEELVAKIRKLCKEQGSSLTKLEAKLGFGNGVIGRWAKAPKSPPHNKLVMVANELGVSVADLTEGEAQKSPLPPEESGLDEADREIIQYLKTLNAPDKASAVEMIKAFAKSRDKK